MILPNKFLEEKDSLLYVGALLLDKLDVPSSVSELWNQVNDNKSVNNYERFIITLDMLYILNLIELKNDKIRRINNDS
ncbi:ABC-three component system middle component 6 [uncultured Methanobrevibacter sp.]|uniref:ABC-three component system middle component 6 n=1 Tax=Methanobrevibacter sp. TaxID=66852 RepID=UPI00261E50BC|nr:ABC-three component system middle component 6 [uncultured Methanobrevibacter sp.]